MKRVFLITITLLVFSLSAWAKRGRLELSDDRDVPAAELRRRIRILQESVNDLQLRVDALESKQGISAPATTGVAPTVASNVTCYIETPFDGIYDATEANEMKARIEAVKACMSKVKSRIHCSSEKVKCGN